MRTTIKMLALTSAFVLATACGKNDSAMDDALKNDLALANQVSPNQVVSPLERGDTSMLAATAPTRVGTSSGTATRRTTAVRRSSGTTRRSSSGSSSGSRVVYSEPAERPTRDIKHTKRDAAIGAVAGAAIGAATSRDKLKGAVIGAAAGGILGGIIGNNVDKKRVPQY